MDGSDWMDISFCLAGTSWTQPGAHAKNSQHEQQPLYFGNANVTGTKPIKTTRKNGHAREERASTRKHAKPQREGEVWIMCLVLVGCN